MDIISRDEAGARGLSKYFTGFPCRYGHLAERYTCNTRCLGCVKRFNAPKKQDAQLHFHPHKAFSFWGAAAPAPTIAEAHATFRYMEACEWHLAALKALRADPALMARYDHEPTLKEQFERGH